MELTTGNVDMHFANVTIEVNSAGQDIFQRVSNGIKAGDQKEHLVQPTPSPTFDATWPTSTSANRITTDTPSDASAITFLTRTQTRDDFSDDFQFAVTKI